MLGSIYLKATGHCQSQLLDLVVHGSKPLPLSIRAALKSLIEQTRLFTPGENRFDYIICESSLWPWVQLSYERFYIHVKSNEVS
uniref:Uncharacterized protein n=1 Tax=Helianthus annuus TaxID=4232 RepID=A0A251V3X4_HELAN